MPTPLKTLILSASFGGGHHQANEAVGEALKKRRPDTQVRHTDYLTHVRRYERDVLLAVYMGWLRYSPGTYRWYYRFTDRESEPKAIRDTYQWMGRNGLRRELREYQPNLVISSYPTPAAVAGHLRRKEAFSYLNVLVVTDYRIHQHWVRPEADLSLVATPQARDQLIARGIPAHKVVVTGIPIHPKYQALIGADKALLRQQHGLRADIPLILISGGAQGTYRSLEKVLAVLAHLGQRVQVLVLAGAGEVSVKTVGGAIIHRLGFTTAFPELLAAADLVVGKAGGLTVAESTTLGVPMVIFDPIPGQEEYNADYLQQSGAALWVRDISGLRAAVLRALYTDEHARLSAGSRAVSSPNAADLAAQAILEVLPRWEKEQQQRSQLSKSQRRKQP